MGCAISAICAPNYGNVFMGKFERTYIYPHSAIAGSLTMAKVHQRVFVTPFVRVRQAVQTSVGHITKLNLKAWLLKPA